MVRIGANTTESGKNRGKNDATGWSYHASSLEWHAAAHYGVINERREQFQQLEAHASGLIIGQAHLINRMLIALLCDGHLLVEGAPGLAKTRAIKVLAESIEGDFHRLQFTPDLLPADLTGTDIYRPQEGTFEFRKGPLFHNLILADEINRAPAKVQSALLEAMEERQISVGDQSYPLEDLFMVMATQNPIEQEGTYPLPEAQLDRFLLHVEVGYPTIEDERRILVLNRDEAKSGERDAFQPPELLSMESMMAGASGRPESASGDGARGIHRQRRCRHA